MMRTVLALVVIAAIARADDDDNDDATARGATVVANGATFRGRREEIDGVEVALFRGIKYATAGRFESPRTVEPSGTIDATEFGASCMVSYFPTAVPAGESEDCLFVNVFKPADADSESRLPVMVHFYDGGFGSGTSAVFPVERMVSRSQGQVVSVSFNYRLSAFGFLGSDSVRGADGSTGNWGIQDQRAALLWVRRHIRFFGGDDRQVTLMGLSAGAASVTAHLVMPRSRGLFQRAIMQSGLAASFGSVPLERAEITFQQLLNSTNCTQGGVACLKALPAETLAPAADALYGSSTNSYMLAFVPAIDGVELTKHTWQAVLDGEFDTTVDVLAGTVRDESGDNVFTLPGLTMDHFRAFVGGYTVDAAATAQAEALYTTQYEIPAVRGTYNDEWWQTVGAVTDAAFFCQTRRALRAIVSHRAPWERTYSYMMTHPSQQEAYARTDRSGNVVVGHTTDVAYQFNCPVKRVEWEVDLSSCAFDDAGERQLAHDFSGFFTQFAISGRPAPESVWRPYDLATEETLMMDIAEEHGGTGFTHQEAVRSQFCDFWDMQVEKALEPPAPAA